jgi:hypothetical protein
MSVCLSSDRPVVLKTESRAATTGSRASLLIRTGNQLLQNNITGNAPTLLVFFFYFLKYRMLSEDGL